MYRTIKYCNDRNDAPLSNDNIRYAMHRVIVEEEAYDHNINVDTFNQKPVTPNKQGENENTIWTSEKRNKSDALADTSK